MNKVHYQKRDDKYTACGFHVANERYGSRQFRTNSLIECVTCLKCLSATIRGLHTTIDIANNTIIAVCRQEAKVLAEKSRRR